MWTFQATNSLSAYDGVCKRTLHVLWPGIHGQISPGHGWPVQEHRGIFEIESFISEFPIHFSSAGDPRFSSIVIHSSEGIGDYGI